MKIKLLFFFLIFNCFLSTSFSQELTNDQIDLIQFNEFKIGKIKAYLDSEGILYRVSPESKNTGNISVLRSIILDTEGNHPANQFAKICAQKYDNLQVVTLPIHFSFTDATAQIKQYSRELILKDETQTNISGQQNSDGFIPRTNNQATLQWTLNAIPQNSLILKPDYFGKIISEESYVINHELHHVRLGLNSKKSDTANSYIHYTRLEPVGSKAQQYFNGIGAISFSELFVYANDLKSLSSTLKAKSSQWLEEQDLNKARSKEDIAVSNLQNLNVHEIYFLSRIAASQGLLHTTLFAKALDMIFSEIEKDGDRNLSFYSKSTHMGDLVTVLIYKKDDFQFLFPYPYSLNSEDMDNPSPKLTILKNIREINSIYKAFYESVNTNISSFGMGESRVITINSFNEYLQSLEIPDESTYIHQN